MTWMNWIPVQDAHKREDGTAWLVTWEGSKGAATCRPAVWRDGRHFQNDDFGPGWVCYFTGIPLTDKISHVLPMPPRAPDSTVREK